MFKAATISNFIAYDVFMIPFVTVMVLYVTQSVKIIWTSLLVAYIFVNVSYFFMIWGMNLRGTNFETCHFLKTDKRLSMVRKSILMAHPITQ